MKFHPRYEFQCGACGSVVWSTVKKDGYVLIRCTNRGCVNHGKHFRVEIPALEGTELPKEDL